MSDFISKKKRSELMSKIKSQNTKLELDFLKLLSAKLYPMGYRYRKHYRGIYGVPDVVFVAPKVAIFIDSEFWHGYQFDKNKKFLKTDFWLKKITRNIARDKEVNKKLKKEGWKVLRFWESRIKKQPEKVLSSIMEILDSK
ncbi:MAG: very short patch repair endonuclease [Chloroherpetonaceae bacterium]